LNRKRQNVAFIKSENPKSPNQGGPLEISNSTILGAAGEHYVMCQLLRRHMIAALAPVGVPDADIIVTNRTLDRPLSIQVKARRDIGADGGWHMKAKHERMIGDLLFYCFIDFGRSTADHPQCWILPSAVVANVLSVSHRAWLDKPGLKGPHKDHDMRRFLPDYKDLAPDHGFGWLEKYSEAWSFITHAYGQSESAN